MVLDDISRFTRKNTKAPDTLWRVQSAYESAAVPILSEDEQLTDAEIRIIEATSSENPYFGVFTKFRLDASRWTDGSFPVWYGADTPETSFHESLYHAVKFQINTFGPDALTGWKEVRRVISVNCNCDVIDVVGLERRNNWLTSNDYSQCQQLGRYIWNRDHSGIKYKSARSAGACAAIMKRKVLQNPKKIDVVTFEYNGDYLDVRDSTGKSHLTRPL